MDVPFGRTPLRLYSKNILLSIAVYKGVWPELCKRNVLNTEKFYEKCSFLSGISVFPIVSRKYPKSETIFWIFTESSLEIF